MGRPKGSKNKPKLTVVDPNGDPPSEIMPAQGMANDMDGDTLIGLFGEHVRKYMAKLDAKKACDADLKNFCKLIRNDFGAHGVDMVKRAVKLKTAEGEAEIKAHREAMERVDRWLRMPWGTQGEMEFSQNDEQSAFAKGKHAGLFGERCSVPAELHVTLHGHWINGWQDGQAALLKAKMRTAEPDNDDAADVRPRHLREASAERQAEERKAEAAAAESDEADEASGAEALAGMTVRQNDPSYIEE